MLTPNKLNYGTCPYCKVLLNLTDFIPLSALGNHNFVETNCPNQYCNKNIEVRVKITFDVLIEESPWNENNI